MPEPICPSVTVDLDFETDAQADAANVPFETFLQSVPGRNSAAPVVEYVEDDHAVYLRGTIWLAAYDEQVARAAGDAISSWADEQGFDCKVMF